MWQGEIVSIYIASEASQPTQVIDEVQAVPGIGLRGDRFHTLHSKNPGKHDPAREVTLIEIEAIEAIKRETGITIEPGEARRNLITRNVPLNHLVGKEFRVGEVTLRGIRLCEPCNHLAQLTQPEVQPALVHRGGLRATIVTEGMIHPGDIVQEIET